MAATDLYGLVGQVLDGQFRVDRPIGEGGFSVVYRGHHVGLDEPVAIKCLKLQAQLGSALVESFVQRFRDESRLHYRLSQGSLHIARTIAAGTTTAPATSALVPYMVLEWLEGYTLAEELRARRMRGERGRPLFEVIRMLDPVADAMAYAHAQGVVHRDLNPSNIFVAHAGGGQKLKVLDFGVAKLVSDHALSLGPRAATLGQIRMFTPAYGAPEQFDVTLGPIAPYTDVYAFALLVVELLTDRTPVDAEHLGEHAERALDRTRRPTPRSLGATVGDAVEAVMARALSVDPSLRPGDIGQLWGMLKNAAARDVELGRSSAPTHPTPAPIVPAGKPARVDQLGQTAPPSVVLPNPIVPAQLAGGAPLSARSAGLAATTPETVAPVLAPRPPSAPPPHRHASEPPARWPPPSPPPVAPQSLGARGTMRIVPSPFAEPSRSTPPPAFAAPSAPPPAVTAPPTPMTPPTAMAPPAPRAPSMPPPPRIDLPRSNRPLLFALLIGGAVVVAGVVLAVWRLS